jgi:hypothetical protein
LQLSDVEILTIATVMVASAGIAVLGEATLNVGDPGERRVVVQSRFNVTNAPLQAGVVQLVVDFPSGAWTSCTTARVFTACLTPKRTDR